MIALGHIISFKPLVSQLSADFVLNLRDLIEGNAMGVLQEVIFLSFLRNP